MAQGPRARRAGPAYGVNGWRLTLTNEEAYNLVMAVASEQLDDVEPVVQQLALSTRAHR